MTSSRSSVVDPTAVVPPGPLDDPPRTRRTRDSPTPHEAWMGGIGFTTHEVMILVDCDFGSPNPISLASSTI